MVGLQLFRVLYNTRKGSTVLSCLNDLTNEVNNVGTVESNRDNLAKLIDGNFGVFNHNAIGMPMNSPNGGSVVNNRAGNNATDDTLGTTPTDTTTTKTRNNTNGNATSPIV